MSRDALVVGINNYPELIDLPKPALDAESVAKLLEAYGDFRVRRLPEKNLNGVLQVDPDALVKVDELEEAIANLFNPIGTNIPDTAILFFAGHGLRKSRGGITEGYLGTSDTDPSCGLWGLSLQWLRRLLQECQVRQQIVWLDCCHSGELLNFKEADPGERGKGRDRCFIAASREFEVAYEGLADKHGLLTGVILQGLDPHRQPDGVVTNNILADFINQALKGVPQRPIYANSGDPILLTSRQQEFIKPIQEGVCPYRGLRYFDFNDEDAQCFYGRTALTDQLLEKVSTSNFLAVLGASGSGKSSVVRAGLLYQLKLGQKLSGSDQWKIYPPFTPGEQDKNTSRALDRTPLQNLARVFVEPELSPVDRATQLTKAEELIETGVEGLKALIEATEAPRVVLVVDQFEEVFTLFGETERQQFFECLLGAVEQTGGKLCLVLTMRADFLGKCAEQDYAGLAQHIQKQMVMVTPMTQEELEEAITKPAQQVGVEIERGLVNQMIEDVEGSPGSLPLLQYTLTELWNQRTVNWLTLTEYNRLGGVKGALQEQANKIYADLSPQEQPIAKRIFLELTQLGEGTEDTRRRVLKSDLIASPHSAKLVDQVIQKLVAARLVVTDEWQARGDSSDQDQTTVTVVDVAHEALIRHWSQLRQWLDENRDMLRRKRQIEIETKQWIDTGQSQERGDLLSGNRLVLAEEFFEEYPEELSPTAIELIQLSQDARTQARLEEIEAQVTLEKERQAKETARKEKQILETANQKAKRRIRIGSIILTMSLVLAVVLLGSATISFQKRQEAEEGTKLEQAGVSALRQLRSGELEALISAMQSGQALKALIKDGRPPQDYPAASPILALQKILDTIYEQNRLNLDQGEVKSVSFSPNGQLIATAGKDGTVQLWNLSGQKQGHLEGHEGGVLGGVNSVSFSPNGQLIATAGVDNTVRLWNISGKQLMQMDGHQSEVNSVSFSSNGQQIASAGQYGTVRLWDLSGREQTKIEAHNGGVTKVIFSPDGNTIATAGQDGLVRLWDKSGTKLTDITGHQGQQVFSVSFSPNGQYLATAADDNTARIWNLSGEEQGILKGHQGWVTNVSFSPNGKRLATASDDGTARVWDFSGQEIAQLQGHRGVVWSATFSPDGKYVVTSGRDGTVRIWNFSPRQTVQFSGFQQDVNTVNFSPDGQLIVGAGDEGIARIWDLSGNQQIQWQANPRGAVWAVTFSPDGQMIATGGYNNVIRLWDLSGNLKATLKGHKSWVNSISFSPDGQLIATSGADKTARLWNLSGEQLATLEGHKDVVYQVSFSPDGQLIATGAWDGTIGLWDKSGKPIKQWQGHQGQIRDLIFNPDGQSLITADNNSRVRSWNLSGKKKFEFFSYQSGINGLSFSSKGQYLVTAGIDGTVRVWDLQGRQISEFTNTKGAIWGINVSPDGQFIVAGGDIGSVQLWQVKELDELLNQGCKWLSGYLTSYPDVMETLEVCNK